MDHVVLDIEIQRNPEDFPERWEATDKLGVSCAVLYEFGTGALRVYGSEDVPRLQDRLLKADRITGYNIARFDFPVIWGIPARQPIPALAPRTDDLLARIWRALGLDETTFSEAHRGWGLDAVARGTLGRGKTGYGGDAPRWYQAGLWAKVVDYCLADVGLERDLCRFVDRHGFVVNGNTDQLVRVGSWAPLA